MLTMLRFEMKKIYSSRIVMGSLAVMLLFCFVLLQAYCFNHASVILPDGLRLSGREAIAYQQSIARKYEGDFTDETVKKMVSDFSLDYPREYAEMLENGRVNSSMPSVYLYLNRFIPPQNYSEIGSDTAADGGAIPPLTKAGLISIRDYGAAFAYKPLQYGYGDSWAFFFLGFCGPTITMAIPVLVVIIIAVSGVFSCEYQTKMDALILTARYGKSRHIIAKLLASILFATILIGGVFLLFCIAFGLQYGFSGWKADMQTNLALSLLEVKLPFTNLQLILFGLMIVWLAGLFSASVTAMISALTKTPFSTLIIAFSVFVLPAVIRRILPTCALRDMLLVFPFNAVNVQEVLRLPNLAQSIYFESPSAPAWWVGSVTALALLFSSAVAYRAFRNHQIAE